MTESHSCTSYNGRSLSSWFSVPQIPLILETSKSYEMLGISLQSILQPLNLLVCSYFLHKKLRSKSILRSKNQTCHKKIKNYNKLMYLNMPFEKDTSTDNILAHKYYQLWPCLVKQTTISKN